MIENIVHLAGAEYRWSHEILDWPLSRGWAHHDIAVLPDGRIVTSHPDGGMLIEYRPDGSLIGTTTIPVTETHGIHVTTDAAGRPQLWVADNGFKTLAWGKDLTEVSRQGRVVLLDLDGEVQMEIYCPRHLAYERSSWQPCAVVAHSPPDSSDAAGLWIADGYGESLVHGFTASGEYRFTLDGTESGTRFDTPHAIIVDERGSQPELYVADRGNSRIVVYGLNGEFKRSIADPQLSQPSGLAISGENLIVTDLVGGLAFFGTDDKLAGSINHRVEHDSAWPNGRDAAGRLVPPATIDQPRFNSPHGVAVDGAGRVLVSEWLLGGRIISLTPV